MVEINSIVFGGYHERDANVQIFSAKPVAVLWLVVHLQVPAPEIWRYSTETGSMESLVRRHGKGGVGCIALMVQSVSITQNSIAMIHPSEPERIFWKYSKLQQPCYS